MKRKRSPGSWWSKKHRDYKYTDKLKGFTYDLTLDTAKAIMNLPCFYCCRPGAAQGIDRLDNDKGHETGNVVPCCSKCNFILSTIPYSAKLEMREALRTIQEKDLLKDWQPVPNVVRPKKVSPEPIVKIEFGDWNEESLYTIDAATKEFFSVLDEEENV